MKLNDLLGLSEEQIENTKLHFAIAPNDEEDPLIEFFTGSFKEWQEYQNKRNFERKYILCLIEYGLNKWIFAGIYESLSYEVKKDEERKYYKYSTKLRSMGVEFVGRLIIEYVKEFRQSYPYLENCIDDLIVIEYHREKKAILPFNGYENVNLSYQELSAIIHNDIESWKTALSSVKGVYIITDKENGKHYIGSAYGEDSFWQRWASYVYSLHGSNKTFKKLIEEKGAEFGKNLQFSILEVRSTKDKDEIIQRETYWKNVLLTREHGYNEN